MKFFIHFVFCAIHNMSEIFCVQWSKAYIYIFFVFIIVCVQSGCVRTSLSSELFIKRDFHSRINSRIKSRNNMNQHKHLCKWFCVSYYVNLTFRLYSLFVQFALIQFWASHLLFYGKKPLKIVWKNSKLCNSFGNFGHYAKKTSRFIGCPRGSLSTSRAFVLKILLFESNLWIFTDKFVSAT